MKELNKKINKKRCDMITVAKRSGLQSPEVLALSQELDMLINQFIRSENKRREKAK